LKTKRLEEDLGPEDKMTPQAALIKYYTEMKKEFPEVVDRLFPMKLYGILPDSETYKKSVPPKFKKMFW
jgi:hypothetical protein